MAEKLTERQARITALEVAQSQINRSISAWEHTAKSEDKTTASNAKKVVRHLNDIERGIRQKILNNRHAESKAQKTQATAEKDGRIR